MAIRILGSALVLCAIAALGLSDTGTGGLPKGPRDCSEVYQSGNHFEGYYAVYPNPNNLDEAGLVYCSVDDGMFPHNSTAPKANARNCKDLLASGMTDSGINVIYPLVDHPESPVIVYCDQTTSGGGWTVFQRRDDYDSQVDFYKPMNDYAVGFGNVGMEFWLGLDIIHALTNQAVSELYVDLTDFNGVNKYAQYSSFYVGPRDPVQLDYHTYQLSLFLYSGGTAGDSMVYSNGESFSTYDADHDTSTSNNCADSSHYQGGWWYGNCAYANLNGVYYESETTSVKSVFWRSFADNTNSLQKTVMMTRPLSQQ